MTTQSLKVVFMGTPDFAVPALQALIGSKHNVIAVYSQPPRPKGRGYEVTASPVHQLADKAAIPVYTPTSFKKDKAAIEMFKSLGADVAVVAAYGLILPKEILQTPQYGCLNIHASLLPRWRGAAPIQRAIMAGDKQSGITIMQMEEGLDTGPMVSESCVKITSETTSQILHDQLMHVGAAMIVDVLDDLRRSGKAPSARPQDESGACYAPMLKKSEGKIDWTLSAFDLDRQVRALTPWPGVWCIMENGKRCKLSFVHALEVPEQHPPGKVLDDKGLVACGHKTALQLIELRPEGSKDMNVLSAFNGGHLKVGDILT